MTPERPPQASLRGRRASVPRAWPPSLTEASGVGAGRIKALDAAPLTEGVLRLVGVEGVCGDALGSLRDTDKELQLLFTKTNRLKGSMGKPNSPGSRGHVQPEVGAPSARPRDPSASSVTAQSFSLVSCTQNTPASSLPCIPGLNRGRGGGSAEGLGPRVPKLKVLRTHSLDSNSSTKDQVGKNTCQTSQANFLNGEHKRKTGQRM